MDKGIEALIAEMKVKAEQATLLAGRFLVSREITQEILKLHLHYNPKTGIFTRVNNFHGGFKLGSVAGCIHHTGYRHIKVLGREYKAARLAFLYMTGRFPLEADHINRISHDDRWANIREADRTENARNQRMPSNNTSGVKGVSWHKSFERWYVTISVKNKRLSLGLYEDIELAELVSIEARNKYHGKFACHSGTVEGSE